MNTKRFVGAIGVGYLLFSLTVGLINLPVKAETNTLTMCRVDNKAGLQWAVVSGQVYRIYFSTNLAEGFSVLDASVPLFNGTVQYVDGVHTNQPIVYYRFESVPYGGVTSGGGGNRLFFPPEENTPFSNPFIWNVLTGDNNDLPSTGI